MSPLAQIVAHYEREGVNFLRAYAFAKACGFVSEGPGFFLMAVPVERAGLEQMRGRVMCSDREHGDTWYISGMAGNMEEAWEAEPYRLPWFAFERGKRLHIWRRDRIRRLTSRHLAHA